MVKSIKFRNARYTISPVREDDIPGIWGDFSLNRRDIRINGDAPKPQQILTLWHELFHLVFSQACPPEALEALAKGVVIDGDGRGWLDKLEEFLVEALSGATLELLQDNPALYGLLKKSFVKATN